MMQEEQINNVMWALECGKIPEDAIYVNLNQNMISEAGEVFGMQCQVPDSSGQVFLRKYGIGAWSDGDYNGYEFGIQLFDSGGICKDWKTRVSHTKALEICEKMIKSDVLFDAYMNPVVQ